MEISTMASFAPYWERVHARSRRVIARIPPERIEWTPQKNRWTLGDLVRHMAALERDMFAETVCGRPSRYAGHGRLQADGYEAVVAFYDRLHDEAKAVITALPDARLMERCTTPGGATLPVWKWLRAMIEHEAHHRGQIYLYLGLLEVETPPLYGLTAEDVEARSAP